MPTDPAPSENRKRVVLTSKEAAEGLGRALCEIANNLLADGKLEANEAIALAEWIEKCGHNELPAFNYVREEMRQYAADGAILPWELGRLQLALERILPPADRAIAKAARKKTEAEFDARETAESEEAKEAKRVNFEKRRVPRTEESATKAQMKFIEDLGGSISPAATKHEASELIGRLLAEREDGDSVPLPSKSSSKTADDTQLREAVAGHQPKPGQTILEVRLPARQPYEGRATLKQKDLIWSLGFKDRNVIDSLGKWQASALIDQMKTQQKSGCASTLACGIILTLIVVIIGAASARG